MNYRVKIQPIGEALGAILPKEILDKMNVGPNDELLAVHDRRRHSIDAIRPDACIWTQSVRGWQEKIP